VWLLIRPMNEATPWLIGAGTFIFLMGAIAGGLIGARFNRRTSLPTYRGTKLSSHMEGINR
jgi:hypothetical protein